MLRAGATTDEPIEAGIRAIQQYHRAADEFARGAAGPVKALYSHADDVTLANPFGPPVVSWRNASAALDFASTRFRDGEVTGFDGLAKHLTKELACILEMEHWRAKVSGREEITPFDLRVTTVFRREGDAWKVVHRHADPISTSHPDGPLRTS